MSLSIVAILLRPVSNGQILYPILAVLALTSFCALVYGRRRASKEILAVLLIAVTIGGYGSVVGMNNPGVLPHAAVWILGPLIFGLWALAADERMLKAVMASIAWATIALSLLIIFYVSSELGLVPNVLPGWLVEMTGAGFNIDDNATAIRLYGLSTLTAAAPMWVVAAFLPNHRLMPGRTVRVVAASTAVIATLLGGRNAIVIVLALVPIGIFFTRMVARRAKLPVRRNPVVFFTATCFLLAVPLLASKAISNPALLRAWDRVQDFLTSSGDQSVRVEQVDRLLNGWAQSPLLGNGLGAVIPGYSREVGRPWNFEMQYHMLLFQLGIVGWFAVIALAWVAIRALVRASQLRPDLNPVIWTTVAGAASMLIANASNPYLQAPGHMWAIWLPMLVANIALVGEQHTSLPAKQGVESQ